MSKLKANILELETMYLNTTYVTNSYMMELKSKGWKFYVVDQQRGRCYYYDKVITIPKWALYSTDDGYATYYLSHEMAHCYTIGDEHGLRFMNKFKEICPAEFHHYELGYKPRNASAAGISRKQIQKTIKLNINIEDML